MIVGGHTGRVHDSRDATDQARALAALEASHEELRVAFDDAPIGMVMLRAGSALRPRIVRSNRAVLAMLGPMQDTFPPTPEQDPADPMQNPADPVQGRLWLDVRRLHPQDRARGEAFAAELLSGPVPATRSAQVRLHTDHGVTDVWMQAAITPGAQPDERVVLLHVLDVTAQRRTEQQLAGLALTDPITGVGNRSRFQQTLRDWLGSAVPGRHAVAVLLLDLDRFKLVNDSLGHLTGDLLLARVAQRLQAFVQPSWLVCRLGGDEFAVLIDGAPDPPELGRIARRLGDSLTLPYTLPGDLSIVCTASLGISRSDDPAASAEDLYREADLALYAAKDTGRDTWALFDNKLKARADRRIESERRLRTALAHDGVRMFLQPVVDLATRRTVAAEALVRLEHPELGLLEPADFIQVAEDTGLVVHIDARITELALARLARAGTDPDLQIAVNLSASSLDHVEYLQRLTAALDRYAVAPRRLLIEVTESSLLDASGPRAHGLAEIRRLGLQIGIDDFGTGYSALAYLDRFHLDFLKIDRSFVARLGTGSRSVAIAAAIVSLAHAHGLLVTAEGVERPGQAEQLHRMGCDRAQGFHFGHPVLPG